MRRRVTRAPVPRPIPTILEVATVLAATALTTSARADVDAGPSDGGALETALVIEAHQELVVFVDGVERGVRDPIAVSPGEHELRFRPVQRSEQNERTIRVVILEGQTLHVSAPMCPYHPDVPLGGAPPLPAEPHGGCCGGTRYGQSAPLDLHAVSAVALAAAVACKRRRRRP